MLSPLTPLLFGAVPQEMQQIFVTPDSIYALLWDLARKPKDGQDVESHWREMVAQQVHWAMLIQACAPGSSVSVPRHSVTPP